MRRVELQRALAGLLLIGAVAGAFAASGDPERSSADSEAVPWPLGRAPTATELAEAVAAAEALEAQERFEEFLEASELGEAREHVTLEQAEIDAGRLSLDQLFAFGDAFFEHEHTELDGHGGPGVEPLLRVHVGARGGRDTFSCAGCHSQGGVDGAGAASQTAFLDGDGERPEEALQRNPPMVLGLGLVQALAAQMSQRLAYQRGLALEEAASSGRDARVELEAEGVSFGALVAHPDGSVDTAEVEGIDADLVVRPFGWKGNVARLRRFVENAARIHFGVQSHVLVEAQQEERDPLLGEGERWWDPDDDGVPRELLEGTITAAAVYLILLEVPVILPPADAGLLERWGRGQRLFEEVGCASCHRPELPLRNVTWVERPDTTGGAGVEINVLRDGEAPRGGARVRLFSDLRRHRMGAELADPHDDPSGVPAEVFLTRPLWGLAETAPYLHDGRAATIPEAILEHGGEAEEARDAFAALPEASQADLHLFLLSLSRSPRLRVPR